MSATGFLINNRGEYKPDIGSSILPILDGFEDSLSFHKTLEDYVETPLAEMPNLAAHLGLKNIIVKDEGSRFGTCALKILGATYAVHKSILIDKSIKGICTATDGNHGRALAWAARKYNYKAKIFVPKHTTQSRIKFIEELGAQVIVSTGDYDKAVKEAAEFSKEKGFALIQDTAWLNYYKIPATITAGYYTQMQEINAQTQKLKNPNIDAIFIQSGVGSWPSAVVHFIRKYNQNNRVKIICVEPFESDALYESVKRASLASTRKSQRTIMAGLNCGTPSYLAYEVLKQGVDAFLIISDEFAIDAIKYLNAPLPGDEYIASGESGCAGLAGAIAVMQNKKLSGLKEELGLNIDSNILVFNTENVTDPELHEQIMSGIFSI